MTRLIAKAIDKTMGLRVDAETETLGLDSTIHAETAYEIPAAGVGHAPGGFSGLHPERAAENLEHELPSSTAAAGASTAAPAAAPATTT